MDLQYVPRRFLRDRLMEGWRLVSGIDYAPDEYAFVMIPPGAVLVIPSKSEVARIMRPFFERDIRCSNRVAANLGRSHEGWSNRSEKKWTDFRARLVSQVSA